MIFIRGRIVSMVPTISNSNFFGNTSIELPTHAQWVVAKMAFSYEYP